MKMPHGLENRPVKKPAQKVPAIILLALVLMGSGVAPASAMKMRHDCCVAPVQGP